VQDLVATFLLIAVPIIAFYNINGGGNFFGTISILVLRGIIVISIIYLIARKIFPKLFNFLAKNQEVLFIFSIAWGLILSAIFYKIGYSIEIGALVAGISLASSKYSVEISARLRPLRDFFIVLFFILLGAHLEFTNIFSQILPLTILSLFVLIGNPFIVFILMNLLGFKRKIGFMAGLTVAQISEFSLILMALGFDLGHVSKDSVSLITLVGLISITGSTYFIRYADKIYLYVEPVLKFLEFRKKKQRNDKEIGEIYDTIIFGFGRVGSEFAHKLKIQEDKFLIVEYNPIVLKEFEKGKFNFAFGDAEDMEFLDEINLSKAKRVITTIPDFNINRLLIKYYKNRNSDGVIISVAKDIKEAENLYEENADFVMITYLLGAHHASSLLENYNSNKDIFKLAKKEYLNYIKDHKENILNYNK
jgi:voltage-gated potassium channel Kch